MICNMHVSLAYVVVHCSHIDYPFPFWCISHTWWYNLYFKEFNTNGVFLSLKIGYIFENSAYPGEMHTGLHFNQNTCLPEYPDWKGFAKVPVYRYPEWKGCQSTCLPVSRMKMVPKYLSTGIQNENDVKVPVYRYPEWKWCQSTCLPVSRMEMVSKYLFTGIQNGNGVKVPVYRYPEWKWCQSTCLQVSRMKRVCQSTCLPVSRIKGVCQSSSLPVSRKIKVCQGTGIQNGKGLPTVSFYSYPEWEGFANGTCLPVYRIQNERSLPKCLFTGTYFHNEKGWYSF